MASAKVSGLQNIAPSQVGAVRAQVFDTGAMARPVAAIQPDDLVPLRQRPLDEVRADEARCAGYKDPHDATAD